MASAIKKKPMLGSPLWFTPAPAEKAKGEKIKKPRVNRKNDLLHVAAARGLRDQYLEQFNLGRILPGGKYEVRRSIEMSAAAAKPALLPEAA